MAVVDVAVKPSPPPSPPLTRITVMVMAFVRFIIALILGFLRVVYLVAPALPYLGFATAWVISVGMAATIVARHAYRKGSTPLIFLEAFTQVAFKFSICIISLFLALLAVFLCGLCLAYLVAVVCGSGSEFKKNTFGEITWESTRELCKFPRAAILGFAADLACIVLIVAGILVMIMSPHVDKSISHGQRIGSLIADVGSFGLHAAACFVIIPALAFDIWRKDQADKKSGLTVADC